MVGGRYIRLAYSIPATLCVLILSLFALPVSAQHGGSGGGSHGGSGGGIGGGGIGTSTRAIYTPAEPGTNPNAEPGVIVPTSDTNQKPVVNEDETCLPWILPVAHAASVSVASLGVSGKARSQYQKACDAFKKKKLTEAEQHARDAIQVYPKYPAAWVMLGKVLGDEQKIDEAHEACSTPMKSDPTYLPPYLCLAGLLDSEQRWDDLLTWTDRFRGMNQAGDIYSDYYRSLSFFHLNKLPEAQKSATEAIGLDSQHNQPGLFFLLAQIYGQQGDVAGAAAQVHQFVKYATSKQDKDTAKEYLAEIQSKQTATK
jgi:tetratricopeptide (TPR) repeat protein